MIRHKFQRQLVGPSVARAFLRIWLPGPGEQLQRTRKNRKHPGSNLNAENLLYFLRLNLSRSVFTLFPSTAPPRSYTSIRTRFSTAYRTGSDLEVANPNLALPLFCLLQENAVAIDFWIRFHRGSFRFHFRNTRYLETVRPSGS